MWFTQLVFLFKEEDVSWWHIQQGPLNDTLVHFIAASELIWHLCYFNEWLCLRCPHITCSVSVSYPEDSDRMISNKGHCQELSWGCFVLCVFRYIERGCKSFWTKPINTHWSSWIEILHCSGHGLYVTRWSIRDLWSEYKRALGPKWPARAASWAPGSPASVALSYNKPLMGNFQKPICFCTVDIILHALLLHTSTWPHVAARQRQGHPRPGTCQHRSWVEPRVLMLCDRQGTTR